MQGIVERVARGLAIVGGLVLTALVLLTCLSVAGRGVDTAGHSDLLTARAPGLAETLAVFGPVTGDYELLEAGIAFAIFAFLPICQLYRGHAMVDVFTQRLPHRARLALDALWEAVLAAAIVLISWRLGAGMQDKIAYGETTFLLQFPVWWAYAASFAASLVAALVAIWCAWARLAEAVTRRPVLPPARGADH